jgi:hypothetical protein
VGKKELLPPLGMYKYNQIKGRIHLRFENEKKKKKQNRNQTTEEEEEKGGGSACFGTKEKMEAAFIKKLNCMRPQRRGSSFN